LSSLFRFFKSVRLAIVLILIVTVLSVLATLVPQGLDPGMYRDMYPPPLYHVITVLDFNHFFSSLLFRAAVGLFAVNLGVCMVDRVVRQVKKKSGRRWGPDLVHLGLLVLITGGLVTSVTRQEGYLRMGEGDELQVAAGTTLRLVSFRTVLYDDGRPRSWTSTVEIRRPGSDQVVTFPIRVNHPLRMDGVNIYQASWGRQDLAVFRDGKGDQAALADGESLRDGDSSWRFDHIVQGGDGQRALFEQYQGSRLVSTRELDAGDSIGDLTLLRMGNREFSGLRATKDAGYLPVVAGLVLLAAGLALTFIQKRRDRAD